MRPRKAESVSLPQSLAMAILSASRDPRPRPRKGGVKNEILVSQFAEMLAIFILSSPKMEPHIGSSDIFFA